MDATLAHVALRETHEDVEQAVRGTAAKFALRYGLDVEECIAAGNYYFLLAYRKYDQEVGSFLRWVKYFVWKSLQEDLRNTARRNQIWDFSDFSTLQIHGNLDKTSFVELVDSLSEDARTVVQLVLRMPKEVKRNVKDFGGCTAASYRAAIRKYLLDLKWSREQISSTFNEISRAIQS